MGKTGDRTRSLILEKTAPLLNQRGFAGLALSDVMAATGLEKGGIYRHFASKDALAAAALDHALEIVQRERGRGVDAEPTPLAQLRRLLHNFDTEPGRILPGGCPYLNAAVDADDTSPTRRAHINKAFTAWRRRIAARVRAAIRSGELLPTVSPAATATLILATLEGGILLSRALSSREPIHLCVEHLQRHLDSIAVKTAARTRRPSTRAKQIS